MLEIERDGSLLLNCVGTAAALSASDAVPHLDFSPTNEPSADRMKVTVKGLKVLVPAIRPGYAITGNLAHQFDQCAVGKFPKLLQFVFDDSACDFATHMPNPLFRVKL